MFGLPLISQVFPLQELAPYRKMFPGRLPGVIGPVPQPSLDKSKSYIQLQTATLQKQGRCTGPPPSLMGQ